VFHKTKRVDKLKNRKRGRNKKSKLKKKASHAFFGGMCIHVRGGRSTKIDVRRVVSGFCVRGGDRAKKKHGKTTYSTWNTANYQGKVRKISKKKLKNREGGGGLTTEARRLFQRGGIKEGGRQSRDVANKKVSQGNARRRKQRPN